MNATYWKKELKRRLDNVEHQQQLQQQRQTYQMFCVRKTLGDMITTIACGLTYPEAQLILKRVSSTIKVLELPNDTGLPYYEISKYEIGRG